MPIGRIRRRHLRIRQLQLANHQPKTAHGIVRANWNIIILVVREKCSCGRTLIKMKKPAGRSDDMLIIRGVNVFPSQIESVLLQLGNTAPYYQLIVGRVNNTDTLEIQVEITPEMFSDTVRSLEEQSRNIKQAVESTLGISAKITLVEPKTIPRVDGKAVRVVDTRKLHD